MCRCKVSLHSAYAGGVLLLLSTSELNELSETQMCHPYRLSTLNLMHSGAISVEGLGRMTNRAKGEYSACWLQEFQVSGIPVLVGYKSFKYSSSCWLQEFQVLQCLLATRVSGDSLHARHTFEHIQTNATGPLADVRLMH
jgi:hypothetical protein